MNNLNKVFLMAGLLVTSFAIAQKPVFRWAKQLGGTYEDQGHCVRVDDSGNVYSTGGFWNTADFNPGSGTYNITPQGVADIYISKLDSRGNFVWAKSIGGPNSENVNEFTLDQSGNIYLTGTYGGTVDFDPGNGTYYMTSNGYQDIFICKLDRKGNFLWARSMGSKLKSNSGLYITLDTSGNIYVTGNFQDTVDFDPGAGTSYLYSAGFNDIFVLKLNSSGNFVWARKMGGVESDFGYSIVTDKAGNIYLTGSFRGTADFNPGTGTFNLTSKGYEDAYVMKLTAAGNFSWVRWIGGPNWDDYGIDIRLDQNENVLVAGVLHDAVYDPNNTNYTLYSNGADHGFILKLSNAGVFIWGTHFGGFNSINLWGLELDRAGNSYVSGDFYYPTDFDPGAGQTVLTSAGASDVYILKADTSGNFKWAVNYGGKGDERAWGMTMDKGGRIYTTGAFQAKADFDPDTTTFNLTPFTTTWDAYVLKLNQGNCINGDTTLRVNSCGPYTSPSGRFIWNKSGTYQDTIDNYYGCDSLMTILLNIGKPSSASIVQTACDSFSFNGITYKQSGTYYRVLKNVNQCDSIIAFQLTLKKSTQGQLTKSACRHFILNGQQYSKSGIYQLALKNKAGCDSVLTLMLTIDSLDAKIELNGTTLRAIDSGAIYQWVNCANGNRPIAGQKGRTFKPSADGSYAAIVTLGACTDTSNCISVFPSGIGIMERENVLSIHPNPNQGVFSIELNTTESEMQFEIYNYLGVLVHSFTGGQTTEVDISGMANGLYIVKAFEGKAFIAAIKVIKE